MMRQRLAAVGDPGIFLTSGGTYPCAEECLRRCAQPMILQSTRWEGKAVLRRLRAASTGLLAPLGQSSLRRKTCAVGRSDCARGEVC